MSQLVDGWKEEGIPFVPYEQIQGQIHRYSKPDDIVTMLGMVPHSSPSREFRGASHAIVEYPGAYVSLVNKPAYQEYEIMMTDKKGAPLDPRQFPIRLEEGSGVGRVEPEELSDVLRAVSQLAVNRGRGDVSPDGP